MSVIVLTKGATDSIALTLTEKTTISGAHYLAVFQNTLDQVKVKFVLPDDESDFPDRYNLFSIVVNTYFTGKDCGLWNYTIYEQESDSNTDEDLTGDVVETGKMKLKEATEFAYTEYEHSSGEYKTYG